jgi:hypothetical protein
MLVRLKQCGTLTSPVPGQDRSLAGSWLRSVSRKVSPGHISTVGATNGVTGFVTSPT